MTQFEFSFSPHTHTLSLSFVNWFCFLLFIQLQLLSKDKTILMYFLERFFLCHLSSWMLLLIPLRFDHTQLTYSFSFSFPWIGDDDNTEVFSLKNKSILSEGVLFFSACVHQRPLAADRTDQFGRIEFEIAIGISIELG